MSTRTPSEHHWSALALLRFLLAMIVTNSHFGYSHLSPLGEHHPAGSLAIALGGQTAVVGFMLISGFSIAHSIQHRDGFYGRRIGRVWPIAALAILLYAAVLWITGQAVSGWGILANLVLLNGFVLPSFLPATWSLSCEALYYIAAPLIFRRPVLLTALAAVSALIYWETRLLGTGPYSDVLHGWAAAGMLWTWAGGFLVYRYGIGAALPVLAIGFALMEKYPTNDGALWPLTWLAAWGAVALGDRARLPSSVRSVCNFLGDLSYPVFLLHWPVMVACRAWKVTNWFEVTSAYLLISTAALLLVDRPLRARVGTWSGFHGIERLAPQAVAGVAAACLFAWLI